MKLVKILLAGTAFVIFLFACRKERSLELGTILEPTQGDWQFQESTLSFQGAMDSAFIQTDSNSKTITMSGSDTSGTGQIFLGFTGTTISKGTYDNAHVAFQYLQSEAIIYQNAPGQTDDFTITVTAIDSSFIEGTFSGTVEDGLGNAKTITNGKFRAPISRAVLPTEPTGSGQLTVWTKQLCSGSTTMQILVGGQTGFISTASAEEPVCGAAENTSFILPSGSYTVTAVCGTDSVKYTVNIIDNNCTTLQIDFGRVPLPGDWLPLNIGSIWNYQDLESSATNTITSDGTEEIDSRVYTRFLDSFGDTMLYRKDGSTYYQLKKLDFNASLVNAPTVELEILHDDLPEGQSWSSPSIGVTVTGGLPLQVKFVSVITNKNFSEDFFGVTYYDLIEVTTSLLVSVDNGASFNDSGSSYSTLFAKGIGIITYQDLNTGTTWGLTSNTLGP